MGTADLEWCENNLVSDPRLRRSWRWVVLALFIPGALGIYLIWILVGGEPLVGIALALLQGGVGGGLFFSLPYFIEASMPTAVSFGPKVLSWRSRSNKVRGISYDDIEAVVGSMWKGDWKEGMCRKYVAVIRRPFGLRRMMWLTPENRHRLEIALRGAREHPVP